LGTTGNDWEPLDTTGNDWKRLGTTGYDWKRLGMTGNHWKRLETTGNDWEPQDTTGNNLIRLEMTGNDWKRLGSLEAAGVVFFSEVAVAGAAGVDVLRVGGRRGLLNSKGVFHDFFGSGSNFSNNVNAGGQKKKSTATSPYLCHIPCLLMQVLLDLWIFRILASLLGVFHLIIQQIKTARSPCLR